MNGFNVTEEVPLVLEAPLAHVAIEPQLIMVDPLVIIQRGMVAEVGRTDLAFVSCKMEELVPVIAFCKTSPWKPYLGW